jgi:peptide/nickel transport system permease protein
VFAYVIRRLLATIPVMGVVAIFVFSLLYITPGDPAAVIAGDIATAEDIARIHHQLGLDEPFLWRFGGWLWGVLRGDLGISIFTNLPVAQLIGQRLEPTLALTTTALVVTVIFAIPLGVIAAWKVGTWIDRGVMIFAVIGFSLQGYVSIREGFAPFIQHLILPSIALGLIYGALIARITRASMLEVLSQDYIRTAQAKGLANETVLVRHALKNAAVPIVTVIGIGIALLISGVIVTETVFAIPGIGRLTVDAILRRDYPIIQGVILLFSAAYVLVNLAVDISYTLLDPRVRY